MKNRIVSFVRLLGLTSALAALPLVHAAGESPADSAGDMLARNGFVSVKTAGTYVERGTYRIQVSVKMGRPDLELSDGTWLYHNRGIDGSSARGTLVIRFTGGRVSDLAIATPAVVAALQSNPRQPLNAVMVAVK